MPHLQPAEGTTIAAFLAASLSFAVSSDSGASPRSSKSRWVRTHPRVARDGWPSIAEAARYPRGSRLLLPITLRRVYPAPTREPRAGGHTDVGHYQETYFSDAPIV